MKRILIVSTFPPRKCGIGTYAYSQAKYFKNQGYEVITLGMGKDSSSYRKLHFDKTGIKNASKWLITQRFDEIHLHFVDGFFNFEKDSLAKVGFFKLLSTITKKFVIVVHEIVPNVKANKSRLLALSFADEFEMHTKKEEIALRKIFDETKLGFKLAKQKITLPVHLNRVIKLPKISVVEHDRYFSAYFSGTKNQARELLKLPRNKKILVTLGFIQRHKGFDRIIDALEISHSEDTELYIVGSRREEAQDIIVYYNELEQKVNHSRKSVKLINKFVSDEEFDIWVKAADALVLPYREIWSSGVGARAKLLGCPVIVSNLATLVEQVKDQTYYVFDTEEQLANIIDNLPIKADSRDNQQNRIQNNTDLAEKKRILVIAPVLTEKFIGGAEIVIKDFISILSASQEYDITVLSTQSNSVDDFNNKIKNMNPKDFGWGDNVKIKRFPTLTLTKKLHKWAHQHYSQSSNIAINEIWKYSGLTGIGLISYVEKNAHKYDVVYVPHYLYPLSHRLIKLTKNNIVHPFIHDEPALDNINNKRFFQYATSIIVNSEAEKVILDKHNIPFFAPLKEVGNRIDKPELTQSLLDNEDKILAEFDLSPKKYIFYIGRISKMKNVDDLIHWHQTLLKRTSLNIELVIAGKGDPVKVADLTELPKGMRAIGFVSDEQKTVLMKNALAVAQLSILESFSLVMVESWLLRTPVIVNPNCLPIKYNFIKSQSSGQLASNENEYIKAVESLVFFSPNKYKEMGDNGYDFAMENFVSGVFEPKLLERFNAVIDKAKEK